MAPQDHANDAIIGDCGKVRLWGLTARRKSWEKGHIGGHSVTTSSSACSCFLRVLAFQVLQVIDHTV